MNECVCVCVVCVCYVCLSDWCLSVCLSLQLFDCQIPQPLNLLEAFVVEDEEYPIVVLGVKEG